MTSTSEALENARILDMAMEVSIEADAKTVWDALTANIGEWWPGPFYCGGGNGKPKLTLEAYPGGRMFEDWGEGEGLLWGTVCNVKIGKTLQWHGTNGPAWGGPNTWFGGWELNEEGGTTKVRFIQSGFGRISDALGTEMEKGWRFLLDCVKAYVEGAPAPEWKD